MFEQVIMCAARAYRGFVFHISLFPISEVSFIGFGSLMFQVATKVDARGIGSMSGGHFSITPSKMTLPSKYMCWKEFHPIIQWYSIKEHFIVRPSYKTSRIKNPRQKIQNLRVKPKVSARPVKYIAENQGKSVQNYGIYNGKNKQGQKLFLYLKAPNRNS